jgi:hypothetical protein
LGGHAAWFRVGNGLTLRRSGKLGFVGVQRAARDVQVARQERQQAALDAKANARKKVREAWNDPFDRADS